MSLPLRNFLPDTPEMGASDFQPEFRIHDVHDPRRGAVEEFIRKIYASRHGADVRQFAPLLVSLSERGEMLAAAGYRNAGVEALFLERYLPVPAESLIQVSSGTVPDRHRIVEIGHFVAARGGEGRRLIQSLALHLAAQGFEWVLGTVTQELQQMLARMGVTSLALGAADPAVLGEDALHWGRYYDHRPVVLATPLRRALRRYAARRAGADEGGQP